jgi:hypothetical protein
MRKYEVKVFTSCPDLYPTCVIDEFMLKEMLDFENAAFVMFEDDTRDYGFLLNMSQVIGIEWEEVS